MVEAATEYRACGVAYGGLQAGQPYQTTPCGNRTHAERRAEELRHRGDFDVKLQKRTGLDAPWEDVTPDAPAPTHAVQVDVLDFHRTLDLPIGQTPAIRDAQLRADLIAEEARETIEAITGRRCEFAFNDDHPEQPSQDLVAAIDGLCDLACTLYGAAVTFGINVAPFWDEVHRTNMAKAGGPKRADGKQLKPPGWTPPALEPILAEQKAATGA